MNRGTHSLLGILVSLGVYGLYKYLKKEKPTLGGILSSIFMGGLGGLLPDLLEPATNPNHRSFFHSILMLIILTSGNIKIWQYDGLNEETKLLLSIISSTYGSHLLIDATTTKGLPLVL